MSIGKKLIVVILGIISVLFIANQIFKQTAEKNIINIIDEYSEVNRIDIVYPNNTTRVVDTSDLELLKSALKPETICKTSGSKDIKTLESLMTVVFFAQGQELFSERFFNAQKSKNMNEVSVIGNNYYAVVFDGFYIKLDIQSQKVAELLGLAL